MPGLAVRRPERIKERKKRSKTVGLTLLYYTPATFLSSSCPSQTLGEILAFGFFTVCISGVGFADLKVCLPFGQFYVLGFKFPVLRTTNQELRTSLVARNFVLDRRRDLWYDYITGEV